MPTDPSNVGKAAPRSRRRWVIALAIVTLLCLSPFIGVRIYAGVLAAEANRRIAELDVEDPGWRDASETREPLPADRDSMVVVRKVAEMLPQNWGKELFKNPKSAITHGSPPMPCMLPERDVEDLGVVLRRVDPAISLLVAIKDLPGGRLVRQPGDPSVADDVGSAMTESQLLRFVVFDRLQRKDIAGAWDASRAAFQLCKPIDRGTMIDGTRRMVVSVQAAECLERTLAHGEVPEAELAAMQKTVAQETEVDFFFPFLAGECADYLNRMDEVMADHAKAKEMLDEISKRQRRVDEGKSSWWGRLTEQYPNLIFQQAKIDSIDHIQELRPLRPLKGFARYDEIRKSETKLRPPTRRTTDELTVTYFMISIAFEEQKIRARLECVQVGLAAERFRVKFGQWPRAADELVDKGFLASVPEDPFDGKPLRMRNFDEGLVVYAVATNKDYAGAAQDKLDAARISGSQFRLWNPASRHQAAISAPQ
jgi:hypothetical protein